MPSVLVYGGCGSLGHEVVAHFKSKGWHTISVDLRPSEISSASVVTQPSAKPADIFADVKKVVTEPLQAVVCAAGGWAGGNIKDETLFEGVDRMLSVNLLPAVTASHIAAHLLAPKGMLVLTGSYAALTPTPGMIAYGLAKSATHHLVQSLATAGSGFPEGGSVVGVLPITLDTPANRSAMPKADTSTWTPLGEVASKVQEWASGNGTPASGSLIKVETNNNTTTWTVEH
eukprot:TRINITY_DN1283_c0_g1_i1.p1 TRINITY_DN1283_c0_g1~~TRINITY_DN1283_c0_g1_i1.p1  ORF type:complete len:246 (+),score=62.38 TRINITY_DN1283_c0_g1_i1:49-738(+)